MRLNRLTLHNFKGIRDLTIDFQGRDTSIYGANGTGKTSIADAFSWLLFGKDSKDQAAFDIKTLDENNQPLPGLDHEVEAELLLTGKIDGKNAEIRSAQMRGLTGVEHDSVVLCENKVSRAKAKLNAAVNEFKAWRSIAGLLKEVE